MMTPISISFILLTRDALESPSFHELQLFFSCITLVIWTIIVIPIYLMPELLTPEQIVLTEHIAIIFGCVGVIFFIFAIINSFSKLLVIVPRFTIVGFAINIGSEIIQFNVPPSETLYGIRIIDGVSVRVIPSFYSFFIFLTYLSLYASLILFIRYQNSLPNYIVADKIKQYTLYSFIIMTIGIFFQTVGTLLVKDAFEAGFMLFLSRLFITTGFIFIVLQFTKNPVLSFSEKSTSAKIITNGIVNWILAVNGDKGPETVAQSTHLEKYFNPVELQLFTIKLLTSINLGSEQYREDICIIPYSTDEFKLVAIGFSFGHKDSKLQDKRKKNRTELLFAVIVPEILFPYLENLTIEAMRGPIIGKRDKTNELEDFVKTTDFDNLTLNLIKNLNEKKVF